MDTCQLYLVAVNIYLSSCSPIYINQFEYSLRRNRLHDETDGSPLSSITPLSSDEHVVNLYLQRLREEDVRTMTLANFPAMHGIEDSLPSILQSPLYAVLKQMPKGGNMHIHENHVLQRSKLVDILWGSEDFPHLYILPHDHPTDSWMLDFFLWPPGDEPWIQVSGHQFYTKSRVIQQLNYVDILRASDVKPSVFNSRQRWEQVSVAFRSVSRVIANAKIKERYIWAMLEESWQDGVQYMETKKSFGRNHNLYVLDSAPEYKSTGGKHYLETHGEKEMEMVKHIVQKFKRLHTNFIGFKRMVQGNRASDRSSFSEAAERALMLHKLCPDLVVGFDIAGEEDIGLSNLQHINSLLKVKEFIKSANNTGFHLFSHAGETSWSDSSYITHDTTNIVGAHENVYDALLLGSKRIGHGLSLAKNPQLALKLRDAGIAVEVCPVCNQILGYVPDLRNNPGVTLYRLGVPVVLGSDAQGAFGVQYFTVDWYMVYLAWGLGLDDLKQLAINSLTHSAMQGAERRAAVAVWESMWQEFIHNIKTIACQLPIDQYSPIFMQVFPEQLLFPPDSQLEAELRVYGRNLTGRLCSHVVCKLSGVEQTMRGKLVSATELVCHVTATSGDLADSMQCVSTGSCDSRASLSVSFDNGATFISTYLGVDIHV